MPPRTDIPTHRLSVSQLPAEVEQDERDFMRLLEKALQPGYTLVKRLGAGGMGTVYLARDPVLKRLVAVKVMSPALAADAEARARFEREAQSVASISHPNVVAVYSVGSLENGVPYLVMQYVEGRTMAERLAQDGPLDARSARRVIGEVAAAIAAAHRKNIIHRDIKPANVLLDEENGRALVSDFGIAAILERGDEREAVKITHTGVVVGTPANMSPEQLLAESVTEKSDIYSLGVLGYELFIGEGPYLISSPREVMAAHLRDTPRKLSTMRGDIDPELERLLEACLAKDPTKRPTAAEVEKRLVHGATVLLEWPPPGTEGLAAQFRTATRLLQIGAAAFALPVAFLAVFDRMSAVRQSLPPTQLMIGIAGIGFLTFIIGLEALRRFVRDARRQVASGYGWGTVLEVASDERGDTGALIAGGREYAEVGPDARSRMRGWRILAGVLRLGAGVTPVFGYLLGILVGARVGNGPAVLMASSIVLAALMLTTASLLATWENQSMRAARQRLRSAAKMSERTNQLATVWAQTFEQVRFGQRMGAGPSRFVRASRVIMIALFVASVAQGMVVLLAFALTGAFEVMGAIAVPRFNLSAKIQQVQRLSAYRATPDSGISALRAGQALHAIVRNGPGSARMRFEKVPAITIPAQRSERPSLDPFDAAEGGFQVLAFRNAARGYTIAQRDFLRSLADNTALEEFRIFGRARVLDFDEAYVDIRPGRVPQFADYPMPRFQHVTEAANANVAAAALDFAAGRRQQAEQRLRENINAGFLLIENGRLILENAVGVAIVSRTRPALVALLELTGRAGEARIIAPDRDPARPDYEASVTRWPSIDEVHADVRRMILDDTQPLGVRWEMTLGWLPYEPCSDLHQVIFGSDSLHRQTIAAARAKLVRNATDSVLFQIAELNTDRSTEVTMTSPGPYDWQRHRTVARMWSALTGNRQLEVCLGILGT